MGDKIAQLNQIAAEIVNNDVCPDLVQTATQLVFGSGDPDAKIVFIGEAPGKNEDQTGLPFVGAAGKFLDEMLSSISLNREDVYITNIVKYRPPNNRDPLPAEKEEFKSYLIRQLSVIEPSLIVTLGRHSMEMFLPDQTISAAHGQRYWIDKTSFKHTEVESDKTYQLLPLYHPAAALYNGGLRATLLTDFKEIAKLTN